MRKVAIYIGSRANYSSALPLMRAISEREDLVLQIVLAGAAVLPRFGDLRLLIDDDGFSVDYVANTLVEGETNVAMSKSVGLSIIEFSTCLDQLKPDIVIAIGDRFDVLPWVVSAAMMNIAIAHTMGGERTGTIDESVRHAITKFAHIHFPANRDAAERIVRMGELPESVHVVGCPRMDSVADLIRDFSSGHLLSSQQVFEAYGGVGPRFDLSKPFILASMHPVTTEEGLNGRHVLELLKALNDIGSNVVMLWPNADAGSDEISKSIRVFREAVNPDWLHLFINLPFPVYLQLMYQCQCLVGNSSSAIREGELIGVPAVNIGSRQAMRLRGLNVLDVEPVAGDIASAIRKQCSSGRYSPSGLYGSGGSGRRVAELIALADLSSLQKTIAY